MYDLGIIGAGPAGYVAAERAGHQGLSVKVYEHAKDAAQYGVEAKEVSIDFSKIMKRKLKVIKTLRAGIETMMKKFKVAVIKGEGVIEERKEDHIILRSGKELFECRNVLIAAGSEPMIPAIKGLARENVLTSREILEINSPPESLAVIGGGFIGLEFASFFSSMGSTVHVIEMMEEIAPGMDRELSGMLRKELEKKGITFLLGSKVTRMDGRTVVYEKEGTEEQISGEQVLLCVGRAPCVKGIGLEKAGVSFDERKGIPVDEQCRTNVPNVYAAGDVTGTHMLAHVASREGEVAVNTICGRKDMMRYTAIPSVVYTDPEVAQAGLSEQELKQAGREFDVLSLPMGFSGRFKAENEKKNGLCRILVGRDQREILGIQMIGGPCSEIIYGACLMIETELRTKDIQEIVFPHPTVAEIIREVVFTDKC
jgi:dihydrolipoamide dehydrogenase